MKFLRNKKLVYSLIFLTFITLLVFWVRFFNLKVLTSGDWQYFSNDSLIDHYFNFLKIWRSDEHFGGVSLDAGQLLTYLPYGIIAKIFNDSYFLSERLIHLWPAAIASTFGMFLMSRRFMKSYLASITAAVVYSFNTFFVILQTGQMTLITAFAFAPLSFYFFAKALDSKRLSDSITCALILFITSSYEPRAFYLIFFVLFIYMLWLVFIAKENRINLRSVFRNFSIIILCTIIFNFFWLFTLSKTGSLSNNELFSRGLFGSSLYNLNESLAMFHPYWTGGAYEPFVVQQIQLYFWTIPLLVIIGLLINRKNKYAIYFSIIALLGVFLSKQTGQPFQGFYQWAYDHVPGFNAFREASKFYFLIAFGYSIILGLLINRLLEYKFKIKYGVYALGFVIIMLFLFNTKSLISGSIGTIFRPSTIPTQYVEFNKNITKDDTYYRYLWLPTTSRWATFTNLHPRVNAANIVGSDWQTVSGNIENPINTPLQTQITNILNKPYAQQILNASSIRYIAVPIRDEANDDDFYRYYDNDRNYYLNLLDNISWLKKINDGRDGGIAIYENDSYKPIISTANNLIDSTDTNDLGLLYELTYPKDSYSFTNSKIDIPKSFYHDLGSNVSPNSSNASNVRYVTSSDGLIHINKSLAKYSYVLDNNNFTLSSSVTSTLSINGKVVNSPSESTVISNLKLDESPYYLSIDGNLTKLTTNKVINLGKIRQDISLYKDSGQNSIINPNFENGAWTKEVEDCNPYNKSNPQISMAVERRQNPFNSSAIALKAGLHTACTTSNTFRVSNQKKLRIAFNYQTDYSNRVGYQIVFDNPQHTVLNKVIDTSGGSWRQYESTIDVPDSSSNAYIRLMGYPNEQLDKVDTTRYSAVNVSFLSEYYKNNDMAQKNYDEYTIAKDVVINYSDDDVNSENLITNPSFENGLWQKKVNDCNDFDFYPKISMSSDDSHTNGKKSIKLSASHHTACTSPNIIPVGGNKRYQFSFDYKSLNAQYAGFNITFNDKQRTTYSGTIPIKDKNWNTYKRQFNSPIDATSAQLTIYAYSSSVDDLELSNLYDNFKFTEIPDISSDIYFVSSGKNNLLSPSHIDTKIINSTQFETEITGITTDYYLNFSQSYNDNWKLRVEGSNAQYVLSNKNHYVWDSFANGWFIDIDTLCKTNNLCTKNDDGSFNMKISTYYGPQSIFNIGLIISGVSILACTGFISYVGLRRYYSKANNSLYDK